MKRTSSLEKITVAARKRVEGGLGDGQRRRWKAQEKAKMLDLLDESGLSALAFSRKTGMPYATLCQWRREERWQSRAGAAGFAEVRVAGPGTTASVHLACGARIEAEIGTDPQWIAAIIKAAASA